MTRPEDVDEYVTGGDSDEFDFSDVPEGAGQFPVLPNGRYQAHVDDVSLEQGKAGPYLKWTFVVDDEDAPARNMKVFHNTSFAPKSLSITYGTLSTILGEEMPRARWRLSDYYDRFVGRPVILQTRQREWEGTMRNSVARVIALRGERDADGQPVHAARTKKKMF